MRLQQWRMRTTLLVFLLLVSLGLTVITLAVVRVSVQRQIRAGLDSDLQHSLATFRNLTSQRNVMLSREAALLADLPSLKALMATGDAATIRDGGDEFWKLSGSDFFALASSDGKLYTQRTRGQPLSDAEVTAQTGSCLAHIPAPCLFFADDRLYVLTAQRLFFGPTLRGTELGFILIGYAIDAQAAREVSEAAATDVAFLIGDQTAASTLQPALLGGLQQVPVQSREEQRRIDSSGSLQPDSDTEGAAIPSHWSRLGGEDYRTASESLGVAQGKPVRLIVLKSYDRATDYLRRLNRWLAALGLVAVVLGSLLAIAISSTVTRPLERLVEGTRALGQGDFHFILGKSGAVELQELASAFEHMRLELRSKQAQLIESDRLATIGRMASSVSHDLRHHLSAIYASAEFMSLPKTGREERVELLTEIQDAVQNMTDLIESLLLFSRNGQALHRSFQPIMPLIEKTAQALRGHPEARNVVLTVELAPRRSCEKDSGKKTAANKLAGATVYAWIDARTFSRAVFNLALNACQAARVASAFPRVRVIVEDLQDTLTVTVEDNGLGVASSIRDFMFQPFVSSGKENGTGLGLTLAQHIAQEHGGEISLDDSHAGLTRFVICLSRRVWAHLEDDLELEEGAPEGSPVASGLLPNVTHDPAEDPS